MAGLLLVGSGSIQLSEVIPGCIKDERTGCQPTWASSEMPYSEPAVHGFPDESAAYGSWEAPRRKRRDLGLYRRSLAGVDPIDTAHATVGPADFSVAHAVLRRNREQERARALATKS